jgi:hypothetical protein
MFRQGAIGLRQGLKGVGARRVFARGFRNSNGNGLRRNFVIGAAAGCLGFGLAGLFGGKPVGLDASPKGLNFSIPSDVERVQPETKVPAFPKTFKSDGEEYELLGTGVRSVSFLSFHVYGLGIYVASKDRTKVRKLLGEGVSFEDLVDPEKGSELMTRLLNGGVSLDIRIVPVRNTDFGHLRDGLVRTTMAHPRFKTDGNNEEFGLGLSELKKVFSRKMSVPKHKIVHLNRDPDGVLNVTYFKADDETEAKEPMHLGTVKMPMVSELLFLQYLSGNKPSSESARENAMKGFAELCK